MIKQKEDESIVELLIKKSTNIEYRIDGGTLQKNDYEPRKYSFPFQLKIEMLISDASYVSLLQKGDNLGPLGAKSSKKRITFYITY